MNLLTKEFIQLSRDRRGWTLCTLLGALLLLGVWIGHQRVQRTSDAHQAAAAAEYERWLNQGERWAHSAAHYGVWAFKPAAPLSAADPGIEPFVGGAVWLEAHYQNAPLHRPAQDATSIERLGGLSPAIVLGVVAPLAIILLGFGAIAHEREYGTWNLLLSQGARVHAILRAKAGALFLWTLLALVPGILALIFSVLTTASSAADTGSRLVFWLALHAVFLGIAATCTIAVSALARSAGSALAILLAAWIATTLWLPRVVPAISAAALPLPTQQAFAAGVAELMGDPHAQTEPEETKQKLLKQYGVQRVEDLPVNWTGIDLQLSEERSDRVFDRQWGALFDRLETQAGLERWFEFTAPWLAIRSLSAALAGTDFRQHRAFLDSAEQHRRLIQRELNGDLARHPDRNGVRHLSDRTVWSRIPDFRFQWPTGGQALGSRLLSIAGLVLWIALSVLLLQFAARKAAGDLT